MDSPVCPDILHLFQKGQFKRAQYVLASLSTDDLSEKSWEITSELCGWLAKQPQSLSVEDVDVIEMILKNLSQVSNVKEQLLALLEQLTPQDDDLLLDCLVEPLIIALSRMQSKFGLSARMVLCTFYSYIEKLPSFENSQAFQQEENSLLETDPKVLRLIRTVNNVAIFLENLLKICSVDQLQDKKFRVAVMEYTQMMLYYPLGHLELYCSDEDIKDKAASDARKTAEKLISVTLKVSPDWRWLVYPHTIQQPSSYDDLDPEKVKLGRGMFLLMIYRERAFQGNFIPQVFSFRFRLEVALLPIVLLLRSEQPQHKFHALLLFQLLLQPLRETSLSRYVFELNCYVDVVKSLLTLMECCPTKGIAVTSSHVFRQFYFKLQYSAKRLFVAFVFQNTENSAIQGNTITVLKDDLNKALWNRYFLPKIFTGSKFQQLLRIVVQLPEDATTDLVEKREYLLSLLNFIIYLILIDKANLTGYKNHMSWVREELLNPLRTGINLSRAHYTKALEEDIPCEFTIEQRLVQMKTSEKKEGLQIAMCNIDLIESVLGRVEELLETHKL